jgi:hypothetical protein
MPPKTGSRFRGDEGSERQFKLSHLALTASRTDQFRSAVRGAP